MDMRLELVPVPVTDVDRAKAFYVDHVAFYADRDHQVTDQLRFVHLTPPGSAYSIVIGTGITEMAPRSQKGLQVVVSDVEAVRQELARRGSRDQRSRQAAVGMVRLLQRPRRQHLVGAADRSSRVVQLLTLGIAPFGLRWLPAEPWIKRFGPIWSWLTPELVQV